MKKKKRQIKVSGYWVLSKAPTAHYVKPHKRKPAKKPSKRKRKIRKRERERKIRERERKIRERKRKIRERERKRKRKIRERAKDVEESIIRDFTRYNIIAPDELVRYVYKIVVLVRADYKYNMTFAYDRDQLDIPPGTPVLQYWHTKFEPTIEAATIDLLERIKEIRAYGDVQFISIDLYRVSGEGPLRVKNWELLHSYDEPEDVK